MRPAIIRGNTVNITNTVICMSLCSYSVLNLYLTCTGRRRSNRSDVIWIVNIKILPLIIYDIYTSCNNNNCYCVVHIILLIAVFLCIYNIILKHSLNWLKLTYSYCTSFELVDENYKQSYDDLNNHLTILGREPKTYPNSFCHEIIHIICNCT